MKYLLIISLMVFGAGASEVKKVKNVKKVKVVKKPVQDYDEEYIFKMT